MRYLNKEHHIWECGPIQCIYIHHSMIQHVMPPQSAPYLGMWYNTMHIHLPRHDTACDASTKCTISGKVVQYNTYTSTSEHSGGSRQSNQMVHEINQEQVRGRSACQSILIGFGGRMTLLPPNPPHKFCQADLPLTCSWLILYVEM